MLCKSCLNFSKLLLNFCFYFYFLIYLFIYYLIAIKENKIKVNINCIFSIIFHHFLGIEILFSCFCLNKFVKKFYELPDVCKKLASHVTKSEAKIQTQKFQSYFLFVSRSMVFQIFKNLPKKYYQHVLEW